MSKQNKTILHFLQEKYNFCHMFKVTVSCSSFTGILLQNLFSCNDYTSVE